MKHAPRILVVEDEPAIAELIAVNLRHNGLAPVWAEDGEAAQREIDAVLPDAILLDWMLPGQSGIALAKRWRADTRTKAVPILMLTARGDEPDKVAGLDAGADDYITKPFSTQELLARIRAVLRRADGAVTATLTTRRVAFGTFVADLDARNVTGADETTVELTAAEFDLLACFLERPKRVLSREQLLDWTRGRVADQFDRTIDVSISRLRRKLSSSDPQAAVCIKTIRNGGYLFAADVRALGAET